MLNQGHTTLAFIDGLSPFIGSGGVGRYIAMPMCARKEDVAQKPEQVASRQTDVPTTAQPEQPEPHPVPETMESIPEQIPPHPQESPTSKITNTRKENTTMNDTTTIHTVSAPVQTSAQNQEPANPLDELTTKVEAMKTVLKGMIDDSTAMSRTISEVAISQRQKEREYQQTKRALNRVRMAI